MSQRNRAGRGVLRLLATAAVALGAALPAGAQMPAQISLAPESLLDRPARVALTNVSLPQGLMALQQQSGVPLAYSPSLLETEGRISCECTTLTVRQALERMLTGTRYRYEDIGGQILIERRPALLRGGDEHLRGGDDLVAGRVVLADPGLVEAQRVEVLEQVEVSLEGEGGVLSDRVERGQEDAEAQGPVHGRAA